MAVNNSLSKNKKEGSSEGQINLLITLLERAGIAVRRENLSRGHTFRVRSGNCCFLGEKLVFVDKRLSLEQQTSVLVDLVLEFKIKLTTEELAPLSVQAKSLLRNNVAHPTNSPAFA